MDLSKVKLWIGTPCFGAMVHAGWAMSLLKTVPVLQEHGVKTISRPLGGDSLITRARNVIVAEFMADADATHLLFIDADITWEPDAVLRLLAAGYDCCCGIYPKKKIPLEFPLNFCAGANEEIHRDPTTGFLEIQDAATGFLMLKRSCIARMMAAYPERKCCLQQDPLPEELPFQYDLFACLIDDNERRMYLSEDFGFSRLWQQIGGHVWMDPGISLTHYGPHAFRGSVRSSLIPRNIDAPRRAEDIQGWMTEEELAWLRARATNMDSVVEVGSWRGRSTYALAESCRGKVWAVDHFQGSPVEQLGAHGDAVDVGFGSVFADFLNNVGHFQNLAVIKRSSLDAVSHVPDCDMVFIDAAHNYHDCIADLKAWTPKAKKLICGHDHEWMGVARAVHEQFGDAVQMGAGSIWFVDLDGVAMELDKAA